MSPAFPIGAFSYSHGLETAIVDGRLTNATSVESWIAILLRHGSGWNDALLLAEAWRATIAGDMDAVADAAQLAAAMAQSHERHAETLNLGAAFLKAVAAGWPHERLASLAANSERIAYPVAVGAAAACHGIPLESTLAHFLNAIAGNLVSVAVRLVPLGQSDGLGIVSRIHPRLLALVGRASKATLDDLGSSAIQSDIASMRHETLYSRVFRS